MGNPLDAEFVEAGHTSDEKAAEIRRQERSAFTSTDGELVDVETVEQFLDQLAEQTDIDEETFERLVADLAEKRRTVSTVLAGDAALTESELAFLLRNVFATRQRSREILDATGVASFNRAIDDLRRKDDRLATRFDEFCDRVDGADLSVIRSLAAELLHASDPESYPLWTRWMWYPDSQTGVVTLVTMNDIDLEGETAGETYELLGDAVEEFAERKAEMGFDAETLDGPLGTDVALAVTHAAYTYLVLGMRMTKEFTEAIPDHLEYVRRLLGILHRPEPPGEEV